MWPLSSAKHQVVNQSIKGRLLLSLLELELGTENLFSSGAVMKYGRIDFNQDENWRL